jgi:hypothetical protein
MKANLPVANLSYKEGWLRRHTDALRFRHSLALSCSKVLRY